MFKLFKYFKRKEAGYFSICLVFIVGQVYLDLKLPDFMSEITQLVQTGGAMGSILSAGALMLLCAFGSLISAGTVGYFAAKIAAGFSMRLRGLVFNKTLEFDNEEINTFSTASLITRSTNDITQIQMFITMGLQSIVKAPILAIWAITKIANKGFAWSIATSVAVVIMIILFAVIFIFAIPKSKTIQKLTDNLNRITRENLTGVRVVRAYNAEQYQEKKFDRANSDVTQTQLFVNRMMAIMQPGMSFIFSSLTLAIYIIGAIIINNANLGDRMGIFSDMVVFSSYAMQVIMAFMLLTMIFIIYPRAEVAGSRINEVINKKISIKDGSLVFDYPIQGDIEFRNVNFRYPNAADNALEDINFTVSKGETVAVIGATGSGKSTLINLIPRFYDATEGEILIDGIDIKNYKREFLRNQIGYASQKAVLFSGTVESNVIYGENSKDINRLNDAVDISQSRHFVDKMGGEEGHIAQNGSNLSGGQKQRLSIARAIYKNAKIMIFDDSFSALDYKTDKALRKELNKKTEGTKFIVAQRIGTIKDADKIIVLDEGHIVGIGKHSELLKNCDVYKEIAYSQLSKEELENGTN